MPTVTSAPTQDDVARLDPGKQVLFAIQLIGDALRTARMPKQASERMSSAYSALNELIIIAGGDENNLVHHVEARVPDALLFIRQALDAMDALEGIPEESLTITFLAKSLQYTASAVALLARGPRHAQHQRPVTETEEQILLLYDPSLPEQMTLKGAVWNAVRLVYRALRETGVSWKDRTAIAWSAYDIARGSEDSRTVTDSTPPTAHELHTLGLFIDPGDADVADIRAVLRALNDLHVAAGGFGFYFALDENGTSINGEVTGDS